jgi:RNase P subunit RPR2
MHVACRNTMTTTLTNPENDDNNQPPSSGCGRPRLIPARSGRGFLTVRCGSRLKDLCPSCAALHLGDWKAIGRDGILHAPDGSVIYFVTLTAPAFGSVHKVMRPGKPPVRCVCGKTHDPVKDADLKGVAIDGGRYEYMRQVQWNYNAGRLWTNTARKLTYYCPGAEFFGAWEFQARGALHLHVLVRVHRDVAREAEPLLDLIRATETTVGGKRYGWGTDLHAKRITGVRGLKAGVFDRNRTHRVLGYLLKAVGYTAKEVGVDPTREADRSVKHFRKLDAAAKRMVCDQCRKVAPGGMCEARAHYRWGARIRMFVVSRGSATTGKVGWSTKGLTKTKRHEARVTFARIMAAVTWHDDPKQR